MTRSIKLYKEKYKSHRSSQTTSNGKKPHPKHNLLWKIKNKSKIKLKRKLKKVSLNATTNKLNNFMKKQKNDCINSNYQS